MMKWMVLMLVRFISFVLLSSGVCLIYLWLYVFMVAFSIEARRCVSDDLGMEWLVYVGAFIIRKNLVR